MDLRVSFISRRLVSKITHLSMCLCTTRWDYLGKLQNRCRGKIVMLESDIDLPPVQMNTGGLYNLQQGVGVRGHSIDPFCLRCPLLIIRVRADLTCTPAQRFTSQSLICLHHLPLPSLEQGGSFAGSFSDRGVVGEKDTFPPTRKSKDRERISPTSATSFLSLQQRQWSSSMPEIAGFSEARFSKTAVE